MVDTSKNEWEPYSEQKFGRLYGAEARCYEVRLVHGGGNNRVRSLDDVSGYLYSHSKSQNPFGLEFEIRRIKNYTPPKPRTPDSHVYEEVLIEYYNKEAELVEMTKESRAVYSNTKGRYIKMRSHGRVYLTRDDPAYVRFVGGPWRYYPVEAGALSDAQ